MASPNLPSTTSTPNSHIKQESDAYIRSLLNRNLRIHTTDSRIFVGSFKCTDPDCNIVLAYTYEYSHPSSKQRADAAAAAAVTSVSSEVEGDGGATVKMDMTSRYLGLVVVPGEHIVKIEKEEFASQLRTVKRDEVDGGLGGGRMEMSGALVV